MAARLQVWREDRLSCPRERRHCVKRCPGDHASLDEQPHDVALDLAAGTGTRRHCRAAPRDPTRVTRRLFLVAGSAGSGKSTLANALAHELDAGWLQLDSIWLAMKVAAGEDTPARYVLDIDRRMRREDEADEDVLAAMSPRRARCVARCRVCWGSSSRLTSGWWRMGRGCCPRS